VVGERVSHAPQPREPLSVIYQLLRFGSGRVSLAEATTIAELQSGLEICLQFAYEIGAITASERSQLQ
jgi:hypothetical protein